MQKGEPAAGGTIASWMGRAIQSIRWLAGNTTAPKGQSIFSRLFLAASILLWSLNAISARAQVGGPISGQWVLPGGTPAANAQLYVCPYTASGIPCSPRANIYADPGLTIPLTQPYSTDQYGNATVNVANGVYLVQIAVNSVITYSYLYAVLNPAVGLATGCTSTPTGNITCSGTIAGGVVTSGGNALQVNLNTFTVAQFGGLPATIVTDATCTGGSATVTTATSTPFTGTAGDAIVLANCGPPYIVSKNANGQLLAAGWATTVQTVNGPNSVTVTTAPPIISGMMTSVTYSSGLTVTGGTAGVCPVTGFNNSSTATANLTVAAGAFVPTMAVTAVGTGATATPTTGTVGACSGGVTVSGTPVFVTTLAPASVSNVWAAVGPDATAAVTACVGAAETAPFGQCYFNDQTTFLMSSTGQMTQGLTSHTHVHIGGRLVFAPPSSGGITQAVNGITFNVSGVIGQAGNCPSTGATVCQIASSIAAGATSFTATSAADAAALTAGQWIIVQETDSVVRDVLYIEWAQVASVSSTTINLQNPINWAFPGTHAWVAPGLYGGLGWRTVTTLDEGVTIDGGEIIIPPLVDPSSGRVITPIYTTAAKDFTWKNQTITATNSISAEIQYDYGDKFDNIIEHSGDMEYAKSIAGQVHGFNGDHIAMAINGYLGPCYGYNASFSGGVLIDLGSQLSYTNNDFPNICNGGIATQYNIHDSVITGNHVGWMHGGTLSGTELVGLSLTGDKNVFAQGNIFDGSDGALSNMISVEDSGGNPGVTSDSNDVRNQRGCLVAGSSSCFQGTLYRVGGSLGTDLYDYQNQGTNAYTEPNLYYFLSAVGIGATGIGTPLILQGTTVQGVGIQIGNTSPGATIWDWIGGQYSNGADVIAFNAVHVGVTDAWYTNDASFGTGIVVNGLSGLQYYWTTAGTCSSNPASPSTFAACFGATALCTASVAGNWTCSGGLTATTALYDLQLSAGGSGACLFAGTTHAGAGQFACSTGADLGSLINKAQYDVFYSGGTSAAVAGAAINGFQFDSTAGAPAAATAAQLGTLANLPQYSIPYSAGTSSALTDTASPTVNSIYAMGWNVVAGVAVAPTAINLSTITSAPGELVCAAAGDTTINPVTITGGSSSGGVATLSYTAQPNTASNGQTSRLMVGQNIGVTGASPAGLNTTSSVVTAATSTSISYTSAGTSWTSGGTIFLACANGTNAVSATPYTLAENYSVPGGTIGATSNYTLIWPMDIWSSSTATTFTGVLEYNTTPLWKDTHQPFTPSNSELGWGGKIGFKVFGDSSTLLEAYMSTSTLPQTSALTATYNFYAQPVTVSTGSTEPLQLQIYFSAATAGNAIYVPRLIATQF